MILEKKSSSTFLLVLRYRARAVEANSLCIADARVAITLLTLRARSGASVFTASLARQLLLFSNRCRPRVEWCASLEVDVLFCFWFVWKRYRPRSAWASRVGPASDAAVDSTASWAQSPGVDDGSLAIATLLPILRASLALLRTIETLVSASMVPLPPAPAPVTTKVCVEALHPTLIAVLWLSVIALFGLYLPLGRSLLRFGPFAAFLNPRLLLPGGPASLIWRVSRVVWVLRLVLPRLRQPIWLVRTRLARWPVSLPIGFPARRAALVPSISVISTTAILAESGVWLFFLPLSFDLGLRLGFCLTFGFCKYG